MSGKVNVQSRRLCCEARPSDRSLAMEKQRDLLAETFFLSHFSQKRKVEVMFDLRRGKTLLGDITVNKREMISIHV